MATRIPPPNNGKDQPGMSPGSDQCREIADALSGAFIWSESAEGRDFWSAVRTRLLELARLNEREEPPPLPDPPAKPTVKADNLTIMEQAGISDSIEVEQHPDGDNETPEWSVYLHLAYGGRFWIADYEIGDASDQFTAEEAEALAFEYAERLLEAFPQLRARGINNSNS